MNSSFSVEDDDVTSIYDDDFEDDFDEDIDKIGATNSLSSSSSVVLVLSNDRGERPENRRNDLGDGYGPFVLPVDNVPLYIGSDDEGSEDYVGPNTLRPHIGNDMNFDGFSDHSDSTFEGFAPSTSFEGFVEESSDSEEFDGFSDEDAVVEGGRQKIELIREWQRNRKCFDDLDGILEDSDDDIFYVDEPSTSKKRSHPEPKSSQIKKVEVPPNLPSLIKNRRVSASVRLEESRNQSKTNKKSSQGLPETKEKQRSARSVSFNESVDWTPPRTKVSPTKLKSKIESPANKDSSRLPQSSPTSSVKDVLVRNEIKVKNEEDEDFIGIYCDTIGCTISWLESMKTKDADVTNGIVFELDEFAKKINWEKIHVAKWILRLRGILDVEPTDEDMKKIHFVLKRRKALTVTLAGSKKAELKLLEFDTSEFKLPSELEMKREAYRNVADKSFKGNGSQVFKEGEIKVSKTEEDFTPRSNIAAPKVKDSVDPLPTVHTPQNPDDEHLPFSSRDPRVSFFCQDKRIYPVFNEGNEVLGPYCNAAGITINDLNSWTEKDVNLTQGIVLELLHFYRDRSCSVTALAQRLMKMKNIKSVTLVSMIVRITNLLKKEGKQDHFYEADFFIPGKRSKRATKTAQFEGKVEQREISNIQETSNMQVKGKTTNSLQESKNPTPTRASKTVKTVGKSVQKTEEKNKSIQKSVLKTEEKSKSVQKSVLKSEEKNKSVKKSVLKSEEKHESVETKTVDKPQLKRSSRKPKINKRYNEQDDEEEEKEDNVPVRKSRKISINEAVETGGSGKRDPSENEEIDEEGEVLKFEHDGKDDAMDEEDSDHFIIADDQIDEYESSESDNVEFDVPRIKDIPFSSSGKRNQMAKVKAQDKNDSNYGGSKAQFSKNYFEEQPDIVDTSVILKNPNESKSHQSPNRLTASTIAPAVESSLESQPISTKKKKLPKYGSKKSQTETVLAEKTSKPSTESSADVRKSDRERSLSNRVIEFQSVSKFYEDDMMDNLFESQRDSQPQKYSPKKKTPAPLKESPKKTTPKISGDKSESAKNPSEHSGKGVCDKREYLNRDDPLVSFSLIDGRIIPFFKDASTAKLGRYCEAAGLTVEDLNHSYAKDVYLKKGTVIELIKFYKERRCTMTSLADRLLSLKKVYLDSILNLVSRFTPLMKLDGTPRMEEDYVFPPSARYNFDNKKTPSRKNEKSKNGKDPTIKRSNGGKRKQSNKNATPTYTCEVVFTDEPSPPKKKKRKVKKGSTLNQVAPDSEETDPLDIRHLASQSKTESLISPVKAIEQFIIDKDIEKAKGAVGSVTRADIVLLYAEWLNKKNKVGSQVFVTDLLQDVVKLMEERKVQTVRIPAGTLMSSSVKLYEEYRMMWSTSKADAMMYLEEDWLEDIQFLVSNTQTSRRNTTEVNDSDSNWEAAAVSPDNGDNFSDASSEKGLEIDESRLSNDSDNNDYSDSDFKHVEPPTEKRKVEKVFSPKNEIKPATLSPARQKLEMKISSPESKAESLPYPPDSKEGLLMQGNSTHERRIEEVVCKIERIVDYKVTIDEDSKMHVSYLVRWFGCKSDGDTWVNEEELHCSKAMEKSVNESLLSTPRKPEVQLRCHPMLLQKSQKSPEKCISKDREHSDEKKASDASTKDSRNRQGFMTIGDLLFLYDNWRYETQTSSSSYKPGSEDVDEFTEKVGHVFTEFGVEDIYSEVLIETCFALTLIRNMLGSEIALDKFLQTSCILALEASHKVRESSAADPPPTKVKELSSDLTKLKVDFNTAKRSRLASIMKANAVEDEVARLEKSMDRAQGQPQFLGGALRHEIGRLGKSLDKMKEESNLPKLFKTKNREKYDKTCESLKQCGVIGKDIDSVMTSVLSVMEKLTDDDT